MLDTVYEYDKQKEQIKTVNKAILIVAMFMLAIVPLIVYRHDAPSFGPIFEGNAYVTGMKSDVFNYYKAILFNLITLVMLGLFIYRTIALKDEIKMNKMNILVMALTVFIMIVPLLSKYTDIAFFGNYDRHEGSYAWFSYLTVFFVLYNTKVEEGYAKYFYWVLVPFIIINLTLGVLHTYGYNIIKNPIVNKMLGGGVEGYIVTTLYNPNFGSAISAVIFSISLAYLLLEENTKLKILLLLTTVASFAMLLTMTSSSGFITILAMTPIILVIAIRFTSIKNVAIWSILAAGLSGIAYMILDKAKPQIYGDSFELLAKVNDISPAILPAAVVGFIGLVFIMKFINRKIAFNIITAITIIIIFTGGIFASNAIEKEKEILAKNPNANITIMEERSLYQKLNTMSSGRMDIWIKTIDLINQKPIMGYGFDTYPYVMAELDKDNGLVGDGVFADKPHNWYLSIVYGSGIIGLIGVLAIIIYLSKGIFDNISDKVNNKFLYIIGTGVLAYIIQGVFNDSFTGTAVVFWILAGVCSNILINNKQKN